MWFLLFALLTLAFLAYRSLQHLNTRCWDLIDTRSPHAVLLLHGSSSNHLQWLLVRGWLQYACKMNILTCNYGSSLFGFDDTVGIPLYAYRVSQHISALEKKYPHIRKLVLLGHSLGGTVAVHESLFTSINAKRKTCTVGVITLCTPWSDPPLLKMVAKNPWLTNIRYQQMLSTSYKSRRIRDELESAARTRSYICIGVRHDWIVPAEYATQSSCVNLTAESNVLTGHYSVLLNQDVWVGLIAATVLACFHGNTPRNAPPQN